MKKLFSLQGLFLIAAFASVLAHTGTALGAEAPDSAAFLLTGISLVSAGCLRRRNEQLSINNQ